jgi:hypothetical protein
MLVEVAGGLEREHQLYSGKIDGAITGSRPPALVPFPPHRSPVAFVVDDDASAAAAHSIRAAFSPS